MAVPPMSPHSPRNSAGRSGRLTNLLPCSGRRCEVAARVLAGVVLVLLLVTFVTQVSWFWPHSSISQPSALFSTEHTSEGIPVYRVGGEIRYTTSIQNDGVDITAVRWLDRYSPRGEPDGIADTVQSELWLRLEKFPIDQRVDLKDIPVTVEISGPIDVPGYYKLRTENMYNANALHTHTNETETGLFYLTDPGSPIP